MKKLSLMAIAPVLVACAATPEPPAVPPSDFSTRPAITGEGYAKAVILQDFPMVPSDLRAWFAVDNKVVAAMDGGDEIAGPKESVYFDGVWPEPGANRRIELTDGHFVLEQVISNTPEKFEYQIWNMTNEVSSNVDYIYGVQEFAPLSDNATRMTWTYNVKPNAGFKRPFVQRFVNKAIEPMLSGALTTLAEEADALVAENATESTP